MVMNRLVAASYDELKRIRQQNRERRKPIKAFLGTFIGSVFTVPVPNEPRMYYVRLLDNSQAAAYHDGAINPDAIGNDSNVAIELQRDENDQYHILGLDLTEMAPNLQEHGTDLLVPPHTHSAGSIIDLEDVALFTDGSNAMQGDLDLDGNDLFDFRKLVSMDASELTIASGAITVTRFLHTVDTQSDASSDDLDIITVGGSKPVLFALRAENASRDVVLKHGTGNMQTFSGADITLDETRKLVLCLFDPVLNKVMVLGGSGGAGGDASTTTYTPTAPLTGTNVQDALDELAGMVGGGSRGGGGGAMQRLSDDTLPSSSPTFGIPVIPGTYKRIIALARLRTTNATNVGVSMTLSGDTGAVYDAERLYAFVGGVGRGGYDNQTSFPLGAAPGSSDNPDTDDFSWFTITLDFYEETGAYTAIHVESRYALGTNTSIWEDYRGFYHGTNPVTSLELLLGGGEFAAGCRLMVWGVGGNEGASKGAMQFIRKEKLTASAATLPIASLPQTYQKLKIILLTKTTDSSNQAARFRLNGDSSAIYQSQRLQASGPSASGGAAVNQTSWNMGAVGGSGVTAFSRFEVDLDFYAETGIYKPVWSQNDYMLSDTSAVVVIDTGSYNSNSPITDIEFYHDAGDLEAGSILYIYGIGEAPALAPTYSEAAFSSPPTAVELMSAFGAPSSLPVPFTAIINDSGTGTDEYLVWSDGTDFFYAAGTKVV